MAQEQTPQGNLLEGLYSQYPRDKYNILFPTETLMQISPLQQLSYELLHIDSEPMPKGQDVFSIGKKEIDDKWIEVYSFSKTALQKLAHAAGVQIDHNTSGFIPTGNPRSAGYKIVGAIQKPDGTWLRLTQSKVVDIDVTVEKTRFKYTTLLENGKLETGYGDKKKKLKVDDEGRKYVENKVKEEEIRVLEFKEALAETKAYTRLVRALLALKGYYTKEELKRPFVVVKISLNIHYMLSNDSMKQQLVQYALQSQNAMFGLPPSMEVHQAPQLHEHIETVDAIVDTSPDDGDSIATLQTEIIEGTQPQTVKQIGNPMRDAPLPDIIDAFKLAKPEERLESLRQWIERKGYTPKPELPKPEVMTIDEQVQYLTHLHGLKDKERQLTF
jgi:hypothetical protein